MTYQIKNIFFYYYKKYIDYTAVKKIIFMLLLIYSTMVHCVDTFLIKDICLKGLQRISVDAVLLKIPIKINDILTNENISHIIDILYATNNFDDVKISYHEGLLIINLKERSVINKISFSGNKILKSSLFDKRLSAQNIKVGEMLNRSVIFSIEKELINFYHSIGHYCANIKIIITELSYNRVNLNFVLHENQAAKIKQINIIGNKKFSYKRLIKFFCIYDNVPWWNIFDNRTYNSQKLTLSIEDLRNFYLNNGYLNFNIISTKINLTPNKKDIYITVNIQEGSKYKIDNIFLDEKVDLKSMNIKQFITINSGELYNYSKIVKIKNDIKNLLNKHGYAYPNINIKFDINHLNNTVKINFLVNPGHHFYVRKIVFKGNYNTKDYVLRREVKQIEGDYLNKNLVEMGKKNLINLGYFENVEVQIKHIDSLLYQVDLIYKVKEINTGSINFGAGFSNDSGVNFKFNIQQNNFLGTGNSIDLNSTKNDYQTNAELLFNNFYFNNYNISLSNKIYYNNFNSNSAVLSNFYLQGYGLGSTAYLPINKNHTINFGLDYTYNKITNMRPQVGIWRYLKSNGIKLKPIINSNIDHDADFHINDYLFSIGWNFNNLNYDYFPTSGSKITLLCKITMPNSDNNYYKIIFDSSYYIPLYKSCNWIFMGHIFVGYSNGIKNKETPFYDNFYASGSTMIRGFQVNSIGPKAVYYQCSNSDTNYNTCFVKGSNHAIGGNAILFTSIELITPIPFIKNFYLYKKMRTSLFCDIGTIWDTFWENTYITRAANIPDYNNPNNIRISNGISFKWISPLGLLTLSYAKPLKKYNYDKLEKFQFNIGKTW